MSLSPNALLVLTAIHTGAVADLGLSAQSRAASIGVLKRGGYVSTIDDGLVLTALGTKAYADASSLTTNATISTVKRAKASAPTKKVAKSGAPLGTAAAKQSKRSNVDGPKEKKPAGPSHNERTVGYVAAVRAAFPTLKQTDDMIAAAVWRVATEERAVAKAKEVFA